MTNRIVIPGNPGFEEALQAHLRKCELDFYVKYYKGCAEIPWLAEHCNSVAEIADYLRCLGYRIKNIVDEADTRGDVFRWVETTNGLLVYVNTRAMKGLITRAAGR